MERQLRLLDPVEDDWRIDDETRRVGLAGVAAARAALRSARPRPAPGDATPEAA
jgi:hypothetical protein